MTNAEQTIGRQARRGAMAAVKFALACAALWIGLTLVYLTGQAAQREHDMKCLQTDAIWVQIASCMDERP